MVFTLTRCTEISNLVPSLLQTIARSLRQIIIILFINLNQTVSQRLRHRVAITYGYDILQMVIAGRQTGDGTVASHDMPGVLQ